MCMGVRMKKLLFKYVGGMLSLVILVIPGLPL